VNVSLYNMHFATLGGGERRTAAIAAHLSPKHDVTLFVLVAAGIDRVRALFGIDLSRVRIVELGPKDHLEEIRKFHPDLFINNSYRSQLECPARAGIYMCMFPDGDKFDLSSYDVITANSEFTASWIDIKWGYRSEVVYSACELIGAGGPKTKTILNVARFFADMPTAHHKRQDVLVRTFRRMVDQGTRGWELHLVGNVDPNAEARAFVDRLESSSRNYPIRISVGVDFERLRQEYRQASIYWHATGYSFDPEQNPSKQEHFGMSIIEAMSAGAVPMSFNAGGPRETIVSGSNGYLWNDPDELVAQTRCLMEDPAAREAMAARAIADSQKFGVGEFLARMDAIIARLTGTRL